MKVYHAVRTLEDAASIASEGFRDTPCGRTRRAGVFVADIPLDAGDIAGPVRAAWFEVEVPEEVLADFAYQPGETDWLVWLVPAVVLNEFPARQLSTDQLEEVLRLPRPYTITWEDVEDDPAV